jgi:hypothetical protein
MKIKYEQCIKKNNKHRSDNSVKRINCNEIKVKVVKVVKEEVVYVSSHPMDVVYSL